MTATCEFSRFDDHELISAGEWVLLNPDGGGIALLSTTRLVYSSPNFRLNREFYDYVFERNARGEPNRLGDIIRLTKNAIGPELNKLSFTLLGDPALALVYPRNKVVLTHLNDKVLESFTDTLSALSKVEARGYVAGLNGEKLNDFSGVVIPTVLDKAVNLNNLANDGGDMMDFKVQNNILFRGKASVENGDFSFSFIIPKDIAYQVGNGKFSFYANNGTVDGHGSDQTMLIGGSSNINIDDTEGPEINLFMNDSLFVSGCITNENPVIFARLRDNYGINTVGNGIGHDITAVLDNNQQNILVLNDYYESELDDYTSGTISYPLSDLEPGEHTLRLKVWDIMNNSSESEISFTVNPASDLVIDHVLNYPNPFTTHTQFYFEHNQGHQPFDMTLQVYTVSGKLVKSFEYISAEQTQVQPGSFRVGPIDWDGLDDFGDRIGKGTYIYRIKIRTLDGKTGEAYQKLVILR